jgi:hypothetical protein
MQCFCKHAKATNYKETTMAKICPLYFSDVNVSKAMGISIAIFIVVINLILQMVIIKLVDWIGEDTHS